MVVCTLNEAQSIGGVLDEAAAVLAGLAYEIVVVDDSADDATARVVLDKAAADRRIRLVRRTGVRGLASAAIAGWDASRGELLAIMDGDGQHETHKLRELVELLQTTDADIAVASRFRADTTTGLKGHRHMLSCIGSGVIHAVLGARASDPLAGFFVQRRAWFEAVRPRLCGVGFKILVDVLASGRARAQGGGVLHHPARARRRRLQARPAHHRRTGRTARGEAHQRAGPGAVLHVRGRRRARHDAAPDGAERGGDHRAGAVLGGPGPGDRGGDELQLRAEQPSDLPRPAPEGRGVLEGLPGLRPGLLVRRPDQRDRRRRGQPRRRPLAGRRRGGRHGGGLLELLDRQPRGLGRPRQTPRPGSRRSGAGGPGPRAGHAPRVQLIA
ncbi:MAG: glycosyltransferase [Caulobacteraceae bacterium]